MVWMNGKPDPQNQGTMQPDPLQNSQQVVDNQQQGLDILAPMRNDLVNQVKDAYKPEDWTKDIKPETAVLILYGVVAGLGKQQIP